MDNATGTLYHIPCDRWLLAPPNQQCAYAELHVQSVRQLGPESRKLAVAMHAHAFAKIQDMPVPVPIQFDDEDEPMAEQQEQDDSFMVVECPSAIVSGKRHPPPMYAGGGG